MTIDQENELCNSVNIIKSKVDLFESELRTISTLLAVLVTQEHDAENRPSVHVDRGVRFLNDFYQALAKRKEVGPDHQKSP